MDSAADSRDLAGLFRQKGYAVANGLIAPQRAATLRAHLERRAATGNMMMQGDDHVPGTPFVYGDMHADALMQELLPRLEAMLGIELYPTYSYARVYKHGDALYPHRDRGACEISLSLNLGQTPDDPWPLLVGEEGKGFAAILRPGDALIYRGVEMTHWREPFAGERMAQVFMHYVDRNGPHAGEKFDGRERLGNAYQSLWRPLPAG
jgi:hypothetical protein